MNISRNADELKGTTTTEHTTTEHPDELSAATDRLLRTIDTLSADDIRAPSLLPGWSRGHVLAHVARNAEAMRNLVTWARTGVETPMYVSRERRNADIERDAHRPPAEHRRDVADTAESLGTDVSAVPTQRLDAVMVHSQPGREFPASDIAWRRLREVEIHHADLGLSYSPADWAKPFVVRCLGEVADMFAARSDAPTMTLRTIESGRQWRLGDAGAESAGVVVVSGSERALLAWLIGRGSAEDLTATLPGPLPEPPAWT